MTDALQPRKMSGKQKSVKGSMLTAPATDVVLTSDKFVKTEEKESDNPFHMPSDNDIFFLRDKERQRRKEERARMRALKPHEKTTYSSRINARKSDILKDIKTTGKDVAVVEEKDSVKEDPQWTLSVTRDRHVEKEDLAEYIAKKREMFLVQYSLGVKRDEMRKLEEIALAEERKLELAEQYLEEDAAMFDEFLKENDKNSVEAIKIAEAETKAKLEKVQDIKRLNAQMMHIKSEISKYEDTLKEYQLYKKFLDSLTPQEWKDKKREERRLKNAKKAAAAVGGAAIAGGVSTAAAPTTTTGGVSGKPGGKPVIAPPASQGGGKPAGGKPGMLQTKTSSKPLVPVSGEVKRGATSGTAVPAAGAVVPAAGAVVPASAEQPASDESDDDDLELYFHDPQQLLDIFAELEEQNLSLIQNSQETEEALEEMKQNIATTKKKMEAETEVLKQQIAVLEAAIQREDERAKELELRSKMFSFGEYKADEQEKMLQQLNKKVEEVYRSCIGDNEANISTLQMLTNIENRLEELFVTIETMPADKVAEAEKAKEKERRMRLREEKLDQQRRNQEERLRRALERAKADIKRKTGKPLVFRSQPPQMKKKDDGDEQQANKEEEEMAYFFQW